MPTEDLLPHYNREMALLVRGLADFARRNPKAANRLGMTSGLSEDPHVGRMLQSFALLAARIDKKLDDDYAEFTEALVEMIYPAYLRPLPSCAIAQFHPAPRRDLAAEPVVPRGTELDTSAASCRFRTVYDVMLSPLQIRHVRYLATATSPRRIVLPRDVTSILTITFGNAMRHCHVDKMKPAPAARICLSGERSQVAVLSDALLLRTAAAFIEVDNGGRWKALSCNPFKAVGFAETDRLFPKGVGERIPGRHETPALLEYFAFPEMFDFVDVDIAHLQRAAGDIDESAEIALHLALRGVPSESPPAQILSGLDAGSFKLFCTPVVNLFKRATVPILLTGADSGYPVTPVPLASGAPLCVHAIEEVQLQERLPPNERAGGAEREFRTSLPPYHNLNDARMTDAGIYWRASRDKDGNPGATFHTLDQPLLVSLCGTDGVSIPVRRAQLHVETLSSNGDLPSQISIGSQEGDLLDEGTALTARIVFLTPPTKAGELPRDESALWHVITALATQELHLTEAGLPALKSFLKLHAQHGRAQHVVDAIGDLRCTPAVRWMSVGASFPSFVRGLEINLWYDEVALRTVSLCVFAKIMEGFFVGYAPTNSYVQLRIRSAQTGETLLEYEPRPGSSPLL